MSSIWAKKAGKVEKCDLWPGKQKNSRWKRSKMAETLVLSNKEVRKAQGLKKKAQP